MEQPRTPRQRQQADQADGAVTPDKPPGRQVTLTFDASMSEDDVRRDMDRLLALSERFNQLIEELKETEAAQGSMAVKLAAIMTSVVKFVEGDQAVFEAAFASRLLRPVLAMLVDDVVRAHSVRSDDLRAKPADFALLTNTGRAYLIAAAEMLRRSGMRWSKVEEWLKKRGIAEPKRVFEWRREMLKRMRRRSDNALPDDNVRLDVIVDTFEKLCPTSREPVARAEAERLAHEWVEYAQILDRLFQSADPES
jgi:hypothetical protein